MIRINLLPFRMSRRKEDVRRQITIFFSSLILTVLVLVYANGILAGRIEGLETKIDKTRKEISIYQAAVKEIEEIKKQLDVLNRKIEIIEKLEKSRWNAVHLLDNMSRLVIAKRMWFTDFEDKGHMIDIQGMALDNKTVADFMTRLENTYSGVTLQNLKQVKRKNINLKSFHITCKKAPPQKISDKEEKKQDSSKT